jgi:hypothetical protein
MLVINTWNVSTASSQQLIDTEKFKLADMVSDGRNRSTEHGHTAQAENRLLSLVYLRDFRLRASLPFVELFPTVYPLPLASGNTST